MVKANEGLSRPTIRKRCGFAKQFFTYAVKSRPPRPPIRLRGSSRGT